MWFFGPAFLTIRQVLRVTLNRRAIHLKEIHREKIVLHIIRTGHDGRAGQCYCRGRHSGGLARL